MILKVITVIVFSYLVGSMPFGLIVAKVGYQIDIREHGSGNIGATNIFRILGFLPSLGVLVGDISKGVLAIFLAYCLSSGLTHFQENVLVALSAMGAILGHNFSIYLKFSGGKGIATALGALMVLDFILAGTLFLIWLFVLVLRRYVSLASITAALAFPVIMIFRHPQNLPFIVFSIAAALLVIFRHFSNIKRLLAGNEPQVLAVKNQESRVRSEGR